MLFIDGTKSPEYVFHDVGSITCMSMGTAKRTMRCTLEDNHITDKTYTNHVGHGVFSDAWISPSIIPYDENVERRSFDYSHGDELDLQIKPWEFFTHVVGGAKCMARKDGKMIILECIYKT